MGKKHAHEEHENHERWVISFADMMTLLFALFVVLYAMKDNEATETSNDTVFAVQIDGAGRSKVNGTKTGGQAGGAYEDGFLLHNAQKPDLLELLTETLQAFSAETGSSSTTRQMDDMSLIEMQLQSMYESHHLNPKPSATELIRTAVRQAKSYHSQIRIQMRVRDLVAGEYAGRPVRSTTYSAWRLVRLREWLEKEVGVRPGSIQTEIANLGRGFGTPSTWQREGLVRIVFTNDL